MPRKGFLLVMMQPPPAFEDEFNAWYDSEHVPERLAVPGIETAKRFVNVSGGAPRFLAMYDLASLDVMQSEAYLRVAFDQSSPWTKRVTGRVRVFRTAGTQVHPGDKVTGACARVTVIRFRGLGEFGVSAVLEGLTANFARRAETKQIRVLVGEDDKEVFGFVESRGPTADALDVAAFGAAADAIDLVAQYTPW